LEVQVAREAQVAKEAREVKLQFEAKGTFQATRKAVRLESEMEWAKVKTQQVEEAPSCCP